MPIPASVRHLLRSTPTLARVPHRTVLQLSGSQTSQFLNGIVAAAIPPVPLPFYSAILHAEGKNLYDVFLYTSTLADSKPAYLLECESRPSEAQPLLQMLKQYILRSKVKVRDVSEEYDVWAAWGSSEEMEKRKWTFASSSCIEPDWRNEKTWPWGSQQHTIIDRRSPGMGQRMLVRRGEVPAQSSDHDIVGSGAYTLHRVLHGVPEGMDDMRPMHSYPMECNLDMMSGLDFRKGCYVGQELTVRTYHKGLLRKRIFPALLLPSHLSDGAKPPPVPNLLPQRLINPNATNESMKSSVRPRGKGKLLTVSHNDGVALALLRIEHVSAASHGHLRLSFKEEQEAGKEWDVLPWRPDWWPEPPSSEEEIWTSLMDTKEGRFWAAPDHDDYLDSSSSNGAVDH